MGQDHEFGSQDRSAQGSESFIRSCEVGTTISNTEQATYCWEGALEPGRHGEGGRSLLGSPEHRANTMSALGPKPRENPGLNLRHVGQQVREGGRVHGTARLHLKTSLRRWQRGEVTRINLRRMEAIRI